MITIFHGDDTVASRSAYLELISKAKIESILKIDSKNIDLNQINNFLSSGSLFEESKLLVISNFFSIPKANLDKVVKLINNNQCDIIIWQDKALNSTQLNVFPSAKINSFKADNYLFVCLNSIKPKNLKVFVPIYEKIISLGLFDLFLYLLRGNLRKQLQTYSKFNEALLKKTYLQIIEMEFQYKTGILPLPKELALIRVLTQLMK